MKLIHFLLVTLFCASCAFASWSIVTHLRSPKLAAVSVSQNNSVAVKPTDSFYDLNYNAAFILNDVIHKVQNKIVIPRFFAFDDAKTMFIPRFMYPQKPQSTAETFAMYPEVADRGTNITFPLKANLILHFGINAFYFDWLVIILFQILMVVGLCKRNQKLNIFWFTMIFFGCSFVLIARGGIINARLLVQLICIFVGIGLFRILSKVDRN